MDLTLESCTTASDSTGLSALVSASTVELDLTAEQLQSIMTFLASSKAILHRGSPYQASRMPAAGDLSEGQLLLLSLQHLSWRTQCSAL